MQKAHYLRAASVVEPAAMPFLYAATNHISITHNMERMKIIDKDN